MLLFMAVTLRIERISLCSVVYNNLCTVLHILYLRTRHCSDEIRNVLWSLLGGISFRYRWLFDYSISKDHIILLLVNRCVSFFVRYVMLYVGTVCTISRPSGYIPVVYPK